MAKRIFLIVLDSFGIGAEPDAPAFGDAGTNTLGAIAGHPNFKWDQLARLGMFNLDGVTCGTKLDAPVGCYARLREASAGYFKRAYGVDVAPDCTIASNGGKQSLYNLFAALLNDGDEVIGMQLNTQGDHLLIVSANGMGKLTSIDEFKSQNRGGKGVKCYKIMEKTGNVIGVKNLHMDDEIMMINTEGIVIRMMCSDISVLGRVTSGVKLMNLSENVSVASIAKVRETSADSEDIIKKIEDEMIEDEKNDEEIKNEETTQE